MSLHNMGFEDDLEARKSFDSPFLTAKRNNRPVAL